MPINWDRYKRYDTSEGFGSKKEWEKAFKKRMTGEEAIEIMQKESCGPYKILGLDNTKATEAEIKKAFRKKLMEWHPDRNGHRIAEAEEMTKKIIAAYTILTEN